jgi:hypothetical protein
MHLFQLLFGRPLASSEDKKQRIGSAAGVSVFGLVALSSAAYGLGAALTVLLPLGVQGPNSLTPSAGNFSFGLRPVQRAPDLF